jgi:hypothetical protein
MKEAIGRAKYDHPAQERDGERGQTADPCQPPRATFHAA